MTLTIAFRWLDPEATADLALPSYETPGSSGMDICAAIEQECTLDPGARQNRAVSPEYDARREGDVTEAGVGRALALVSFDLDDLVERIGDVDHERQPIDWSPCDVEIQSLTLVLLPFFLLLVVVRVVFIFVRQQAALLRPAASFQRDADGAPLLSARALVAELGIARETDRACLPHTGQSKEDDRHA